MISYSTCCQTALPLIWAGALPPHPLSHVPVFGTVPNELWTSSWSLYFPVFLYTDLLLAVLYGALFLAVLWQRAWSVQHISSSLFASGFNHWITKYSPAGSQTRAEMKNPEAQQDVSVSQGIRMMFYMMKPNETSFQALEEVPDYVQKVRYPGKRLLLLFSS